jgi:hypothetical protein
MRWSPFMSFLPTTQTLLLRLAPRRRLTVVELSALRWTAATGALTAVVASLLFIGVLDVANRIHVDIIPALAPKLALLTLEPALVFAGDSRTAHQVDPAMVARELGKPPGYAVNIGVVGADPATVLAAVRAMPNAFRGADVIMNVSPYHINEGAKQSYFYSAATISRLGLAGELRTFVLSDIRTLVWYIQDTFQGAASASPPPAPAAVLLAGKLGYEPLPGAIVPSGDNQHYRDLLRSEVGPYEGHPYYRNWRPDGFKLAILRRALCDLRPLVHRLVVVSPPWAPIPQFINSTAWRSREDDFERTLGAVAATCGFEFVPIDSIDGLEIGHFSDETHLNPEGAPIYDSYLLRRLGYLKKQSDARF